MRPELGPATFQCVPFRSAAPLDLEDFLSFLTLVETLHFFHRQPYPTYLPKRRPLFLAGELIHNIRRSPPPEIPTIGAMASVGVAFYRLL